MREPLGATVRVLGLGASLMACSTIFEVESPAERVASNDVLRADDDDAGACLPLGVDVGTAYGNGIEVPGAYEIGIQNVLAGVTPSGSSILVLRGVGGTCSAGLTLFLSDRVSARNGGYQTFQVPTLPGADTHIEESVTLTPDGLTLVSLDASDRGFVQTTRSASGRSDFGIPVPGDFANIVATGSQTLWAPVLSPDGLAFYYVVRRDPSREVNGIYESVRTSRDVPFPPGTRMDPSVQSFAQYVNGLSTDRLAIFLELTRAFGTVVLTRASVNVPFDNSSAPGLPRQVPGVRTRPILGCADVIGSCAPHGGCRNEAICAWTR